MKLKYNQDHISLKYFNDVELNDFSVITGKNGSGKTHFLEAINLGKVIVEGIGKNEIVYYNYNDFSVFEGRVDTDIKKNKRKSNWRNESNQFIQKINQIKQISYQKAINEKGNNPLESFIYSQAFLPNFDFDTLYGNSSDYDILEEVKKEKTTDLTKFAKKFTNPFYLLINQWNNTNQDISSLTKDVLKELFLNAREKIASKFEEEDKELFHSISGNADYGNLFSFNKNDIESPDFFLEDVANEEKEYQFLKTQNILNKVKALEYDEKLEFLEADEFVERYGLSPVEQINHVLLEYDCNGYFLSSNSNQQFLGIDKQKVQIKINLKHKSKGYQTSFDQLSSGEKTLIALSLLIHKTRKKRVVPRVLLLDEIDSSLHPSMIDRLLTVIQELFVYQQGFKILMATHSPTTIALSNENNIYVINGNEQELIKKQTRQEALNILSEGFITLDEGLQIFDQFSKKELTILTEGNNISFIFRALEMLGDDLLDSVEIVDCLKDRTGKNQLKTLFDFFTKMPHRNKVLFVFDCDVSTKFTESNGTYSYTFEQNYTNTKVKKGIENLFAEECFVDEFYPLKYKDDGGVQTSLDKPKFEQYILTNSTPSMFETFQPMVTKIRQILKE